MCIYSCLSILFKCVAECDRFSQSVAVRAEAVEAAAHFLYYVVYSKLSHFPVCCSVLRCVAVGTEAVEAAAHFLYYVVYSKLSHFPVCCSVLQCVAVGAEAVEAAAHFLYQVVYIGWLR